MSGIQPNNFPILSTLNSEVEFYTQTNGDSRKFNLGLLTSYLNDNITVTGITSSITTNNVLYVAENGDDNTGTPNRLDLPFATPWAAISAAGSNDVIIVFPSTYILSDIGDSGNNRIVKNTVRMFMYPNAIIQVHPNAISDILSDDGDAINGGIFGQGELRLLNQSSNFLSSPDSVFTLQLRKLIGQLSGKNFTKLIVDIEEHITIGDHIAIYMNNDQNCSFIFKYSCKYATFGIGAGTNFYIDSVGDGIGGSVDINFDYLTIEDHVIGNTFYFHNFTSDASVSLNIKDLQDNSTTNDGYLIGLGVFKPKSILNVDISGTLKSAIVYEDYISEFEAIGTFKVRMTKQKSSTPEFLFQEIGVGCRMRFELDMYIYQVAGQEVLNQGIIYAYGASPAMIFSGKIKAMETYLISTTYGTINNYNFATLANLLFDSDAPTWNEPNATTNIININILNCHSSLPTNIIDLNMQGGIMNEVSTLLC